MKQIKNILLISVVALSFVSCNKFLDMTPTGSVSDKGVWMDVESAEYAVNYLYSYIYDITQSQCSAGQTEALTDMLKYGSYNYNALCFIPSEIAYGGSTLTANYVDVYLGLWGTLYTAIRRTNEAIYSLHKYGTLDEATTTRLEGELRFVRAFLYTELLKRYKDVVLYDEDITAITENIALSNESAGWDLVQEDLEFASKNLPKKESANGRTNCGQAYALMSRSMLYAQRWQAAYNAAVAVEELGYRLEANYADSYSKEIKDGNKEAILQYAFDLTLNVCHSYDYYYTPGGDYTLNGASGGGYGTPTQEMVESYEYSTGGLPNWSRWHDENITDTPPFALLEPRFHATILYNGASWKGRKIESFPGGGDGFCVWNLEQEPKGRTTTGYYLKKMVDEGHDVIAVKDSKQPFTIIRYGEVLLNRAEAAFRLGDNDNANNAIKAIRSRVSLPYAPINNKEALWNAIRQERKVELAYEGLWYWDLRRWEEAHLDYPIGLNNYQVHGLRPDKQPNGSFTWSYVSVDDRDRNFPEKMYRFPLPDSELNSNADVSQFNEWK